MYRSLLSAMFAVLVLVTTTSSAAVPQSPPPPEPYISFIPPTASPEAPLHRIFNISGFGFENLAVRANGQILTTAAFPSARLWQIDPLSILPPILLKDFTGFTATLGITELSPDVFYVTVQGSKAGTAAIFSVDMRPFIAMPNGTISTPAVIKEVAQLPRSGALNGMTHIREMDDFVLSADTDLGGVWKINVDGGESTFIIEDPTMKGPPNTTSIAAFGINGLRVHNNTLYYTNSGKETLHKMPIHADGSSAGDAILLTSKLSCDDFAIDPWGIAYVASPSNALLRVDLHTGDQTVIAGTFNSSNSDIISASSVRFGRGVSDRSSVYVTTNGGSFTDAPLGTQGISRVNVSDLAQILA